MQYVGHYLQVAAVKAKHLDHRDALARSSFNRYYYSAFLSVKVTLVDIDQNWSKIRHRNLPEFLKGDFDRRVKEAAKTVRKTGDVMLSERCRRVRGLTQSLATRISTAYAIREIADYVPGIFVQFDNTSRFALNGIDINDAHQWTEFAQNWSKEVNFVHRSIGL